jgi:hypothetical protein
MGSNMKEYMVIVPPALYRAGWKEAKEGKDNRFQIKARKLYFGGFRVYKQKSFAA